MWNALTTMVGYLNSEGYCYDSKCHVSNPAPMLAFLIHMLKEFLGSLHPKKVTLLLASITYHCSLTSFG